MNISSHHSHKNTPILLSWRSIYVKVTISTISICNLTHHYAGNNVSQHHQQHVVPGNRVHFRSVSHSIVMVIILELFKSSDLHKCHMNVMLSNNAWYGLTAGPWRSAWGRRRASAGSRCGGGGASWPIRGEYCGSTNQRRVLRLHQSEASIAAPPTTAHLTILE